MGFYLGCMSAYTLYFVACIIRHATGGKVLNGDNVIDQDTDFRYEAELKIDRKELAEHMMLVDLARTTGRFNETK